MQKQIGLNLTPKIYLKKISKQIKSNNETSASFFPLWLLHSLFYFFLLRSNKTAQFPSSFRIKFCLHATYIFTWCFHLFSCICGACVYVWCPLSKA